MGLVDMRENIGSNVKYAELSERIEAGRGKLYEAVILGKPEAALYNAEKLLDLIVEASELDAVREFCIDLYAGLLVRSVHRNNEESIKKTARLAVCDDASEIRNIISEAAQSIAKANVPERKDGFSALIRETVHIIEDNIGNEVLSLRWIAGNVLYTNVDYLGKLFKKETGRNFSYYVMEKRMEIATKLLEDGRIDKIYEVAEQVGYGSNSQYFSQVFKKYTGVSPLEYRENAKKLRNRMQNA